MNLSTKTRIDLVKSYYFVFKYSVMPQLQDLRPVYFLLSLLITLQSFQSCSSEEDNPNQDEKPRESIDIQLNISNNVVLTTSTIEVSVSDKVDVDRVNLYFDGALLESFSNLPYNLSIDPKSYEDGNHELKVEAIKDNIIVGSKTLTVKIDNTGPTLALENIIENQVICGEEIILPQVTDQISGVSRLNIFFNDTEIFSFENSSEFSFSINTDNLDPGLGTLKLVAEDTVGNISTYSVNIEIVKQVLKLVFPDNFVRVGTEKTHVILSDGEGAVLDYTTHSSGVTETLTLCSGINLHDESEYMLTFVDDFNGQVMRFYVYGNLTKSMVGPEIRLAERSAPLGVNIVDLELPDYEDGFYVRTTTPWSSMIYYNNTLSGHTSTNFPIPELGTNKSFVMNFNENIEQSYKWAFIDDIHTKLSLTAEDFNSSEVVHNNLVINGSLSSPFLSIYGFENETHYNNMSTPHMLYWNPSLNGSTGNEYSYPDIFDHILYSTKVENYGVDGVGQPPTSLTIPNQNISYQFTNNEINFTGVPNYEVGRIRLENFDDAHITVEFIFDGQKEIIPVPKLPTNLFASNIEQVFADNLLEITQGTAESYEGIEDYGGYISNILVPSVPFYIASPKRERIFASSLGPSLLPIIEFPFFERL